MTRLFRVVDGNGWFGADFRGVTPGLPRRFAPRNDGRALMCWMLGVEQQFLRPGYVKPVRVAKPRAPRKKRPSDLIYYPPRGGPGLGCPSTLVINRRTGHVRYKLPWHKR